MHRKTTLDNGLRIVTAYMPRVRSVSICIYIGIGSRYEADTLGGVSHFIEHLLFKGTTRRPTSQDVSAAIEGVGGILNGGTDKELTLYWCKVPDSRFPLALDVLVDMLLDSKFDPTEIEKERMVIAEEINMSLDFPAHRVALLMDEVLYPGHPLGRDTAGTRESVSAIDRAAMLGYLKQHYQPHNMVVAIAGNVKHAAAVEEVTRLMGGLTGSGKRPEYVPFAEHPAPPMRVETRKTEQVQLGLALPGLSLFDPRRYSLDLLNVIMGEGMSSRLFTEIRDNLGLAYSIDSHVEHHLDTGSVTVYAGVDPGKLEKAVAEIVHQLAILRDGVTGSELAKAKELAAGRLMLRMEDSRNVAGWMGGQETLCGRILTVERIVRIIAAISLEDLRQLARDLVVDGKLRMAVVGPVEKPERLEGLLRV